MSAAVLSPSATSPVAVRVHGLSKEYAIGARDAVHETFREAVMHGARAPLRLLSRWRGGADAADGQRFLALDDVSFEVRQGEVLGVLGRNGAGKSTLLKVLSRITEPSRGRVEITGRVASLLEVGTGFHPELTGRENVYLNGAILGMSRQEIRRRFDEIVSFSGVERFLDTPVKRYSSGMYMRLAFSVAAHLESEVLLVDEVLAVGDAEFQRRCLGKMSEVAGSGRTVIFVSHNVNAVRRLCSTALILDAGRCALHTSDVESAIGRYLQGTDARAGTNGWRNTGREYENPYFKPTRLFVGDADGRELPSFVANDQEVFVHVVGDVQQEDPSCNVGFALLASDGTLLLWSTSTDAPENSWPRLRAGEQHLRCALPRRFLNEGDYRIELIVSLHQREWIVQPEKNAPGVTLSIRGGLSDSPYWMARRPGLLAPCLPWSSVS